MSDLRTKLTAAIQYLSYIAQNMLNITLTYLPTNTPANISRFKLSSLIVAISVVIYWIWPYMTKLTTQKKRPSPITTTHSDTIDVGKLTPEDQIDKLSSEHLGQFAPRLSSLTDFSLQRTYQNILRQDFGINADNFEPEESDPDYDVLQNLTLVQRKLLATLASDHRDRIVESLRDDWYGSVLAKGEDGENPGKAFWKDDAELMADIMRWAH